MFVSFYPQICTLNSPEVDESPGKSGSGINNHLAILNAVFCLKTFAARPALGTHHLQVPLALDGLPNPVVLKVLFTLTYLFGGPGAVTIIGRVCE